MKKLKLILGAVAMLTLALLLIPCAARAESVEYEVEGVKGGKIYFDDSTYTITGCDTSVTVADIPSTINGVPVTSIGDSAFGGCTSLASVTIPNSVTSIGNSAFGWCSNLTNVEIPNSVTSIGEYAFNYCTSLTSVTIPDSVTSIGSLAFRECYKLESFSVDTNNLYFTSDDCVLFNKDKTTLIAYPLGCTNTVYSIPGSVTSIEDWAFGRCAYLTSITIGSNVTSIGDYAFYDCYKLESIEIPDSVTSIGDYALSTCYKLKSVIIPNSVLSIGECAFSACEILETIDVDENNPNYCSFDNVLFDKDMTTLVAYPAGSSRTTYNIPDSVTSILDCAFQACRNLVSVTIPDGVTSIGKYAFIQCSGLTSIRIPEGVTSIEGSTFYGCWSLITATIPNGVTSIGGYAFEFCWNLISISIPESVTSIGEYAFYRCDELKYVYYSGNEEDWSNISIGTDNDPLTDAEIIYGVSGIPKAPEPEITDIKIEKDEDIDSLTITISVYSTDDDVNVSYKIGNDTYTLSGDTITINRNSPDAQIIHIITTKDGYDTNDSTFIVIPAASDENAFDYMVITENTPDNGKTTVNVKAKLNINAGKEIEVFCPVYNSDGQFVDFGQQTVTSAAEGETAWSVTIPSVDEVSNIKMLLLESGSYAPVCESVPLS